MPWPTKLKLTEKINIVASSPIILKEILPLFRSNIAQTQENLFFNKNITNTMGCKHTKGIEKTTNTQGNPNTRGCTRNNYLRISTPSRQSLGRLPNRYLDQGRRRYPLMWSPTNKLMAGMLMRGKKRWRSKTMSTQWLIETRGLTLHIEEFLAFFIGFMMTSATSIFCRNCRGARSANFTLL